MVFVSSMGKIIYNSHSEELGKLRQSLLDCLKLDFDVAGKHLLLKPLNLQ